MLTLNANTTQFDQTDALALGEAASVAYKSVHTFTSKAAAWRMEARFHEDATTGARRTVAFHDPPTG